MNKGFKQRKLNKMRLRYIKSYVRTELACIYKCTNRYIYLKRKKITKFPTTIQLPITYKCNFNCKMCGMQNLVSCKDFSAEELGIILSDKLFSKVDTVGINGGEPFLRSDLLDCIKVMISNLPNLKKFYIISNGYFTDLIKEKLIKIKELSKKKGVSVNVSFSVDGINEMQDFMRGHKNAWNNILNTVLDINANKDLYCDSLGIICTVTKHNVYNLEEVEAWGKKYKLLIRYNIATLNSRIANEDKYEDFSVFFDEKARKIAQEFFYKKAIQDRSETYFGLFLYLREWKRYSDCPCKYNEWVTLIPNGNISYCATYSKELGNALKKSAYDIFNENISVLHEITSQHCDSCSHYIGELSPIGLKMYYHELLKNMRVLF